MKWTSTKRPVRPNPDTATALFAATAAAANSLILFLETSAVSSWLTLFSPSSFSLFFESFSIFPHGLWVLQLGRPHPCIVIALGQDSLASQNLLSAVATSHPWTTEEVRVCLS